VALWIAAEANPNEVASRAGHVSVAFALDGYGHLFPGSENCVNDALDEMAATAVVAHGAPEAEAAMSEKPTLTLINGSGRNRTRTCDLSRVKAAL
jgi:hypothetical protein